MKSGITIILILLGVFGSTTVHAQSNCCNIKPGTAQTGGITTMTVPQVGAARWDLYSNHNRNLCNPMHQ
jgi:hypothetical protein